MYSREVQIPVMFRPHSGMTQHNYEQSKLLELGVDTLVVPGDSGPGVVLITDG